MKAGYEMIDIGTACQYNRSIWDEGMKKMAGNIFFTADTHFGHEAMIRFENRPFRDVKDMEEKLVCSWNETVGPEDEIYMLGDFAFGDKEEITRLCRRLNGKKILVLGNHDKQAPEWYRSCGFCEASPWPIIIEGFWILSHEPLYINENMPYANIYGHVHGNPTYKDYCRQSVCVCVERTDYRPIAFDVIKKKVLGH